MSVNRREVHEHYREYTVPNPCYAGDLHKAIAWVYADLPEDRKEWDDAFEVIGRDGEIVLRVKVEEQRP